MTLGDRIRYFRTLRGLTQKYFGMRLGFPERTADIRVAQYEAGTRTPKKDLLKTMAYGLRVSPYALKAPNIDNDVAIMHTFFALEDCVGLTVEMKGGRPILFVDPFAEQRPNFLWDALYAWAKQAEKYRSGEITKEEYDEWRYSFPHSNESSSLHKHNSQEDE